MPYCPTIDEIDRAGRHTFKVLSHLIPEGSPVLPGVYFCRDAVDHSQRIRGDLLPDSYGPFDNSTSACLAYLLALKPSQEPTSSDPRLFGQGKSTLTLKFAPPPPRPGPLMRPQKQAAMRKLDAEKALHADEFRLENTAENTPEKGKKGKK